MTPKQFKKRFPVGSRWWRRFSINCRVVAHTETRIVTADEGDDWSSTWEAEDVKTWTRIDAPEPAQEAAREAAEALLDRVSELADFTVMAAARGHYEEQVVPAMAALRRALAAW